jgi:hypothetical protein
MITFYLLSATILSVCLLLAVYYAQILYGLALTSYLISRQNKERIRQLEARTKSALLFPTEDLL